MKTINLFATFAIIAVLGFIGCKKETIIIVADDPKTNLTTGKWKLTAQTTDGKDSFSNVDACDKDNIETYATNGKVTIDQGAVKCNNNDPQTEVLSYTLSADAKLLSFKSDIIALDFKVLELSSTTLKYESSEFSSVYTYTKQ